MGYLQEEILLTAEQIANEIIKIVFTFENAGLSPDAVVYFPNLRGEKPVENPTAIVDLVGARIVPLATFPTLYFTPATTFERDKDLLSKDDYIRDVEIGTTVRLVLLIKITFKLSTLSSMINYLGLVAGRLSMYYRMILVKAKLYSLDFAIDVPINTQNDFTITITATKDYVVRYTTDYRLDGTIGKIEFKPQYE